MATRDSRRSFGSTPDGHYDHIEVSPAVAAVRYMHRRYYRVLIVEDSPDDCFLFARAFKRALGDRGTVHTVDDGEAAIAYLRGDGDYADRTKNPFPSFVMTDLKMPKVDGFSLLEFLKANPAWNVIPRVVFTTSSDEDDIKTAYFVGATVYHCKPSTPERLNEFADMLVSYWTTVEVPPMDENGRLLKTEHRGKLGERFSVPDGGEKMESPAGEGRLANTGNRRPETGNQKG